MHPLSSGRFKEHIPCTNPNHKLIAGTAGSDSMGVYEQTDGTVNATCFSCGHYEPDPYGKQDSVRPSGPSSKPKSLLSVQQITECPTRSIPSRLISEATSQFYGVKTLLNGLDGVTPVAIAFPYYNTNTKGPIGYKKRLLEDKIFSIIGNIKDCLLFGQQKFPDGGRKVYVTEGEIDCLTLYQVLKDLASSGYKHLDPCVVSLPSGAASAASAIGNNLDFLAKFEEIVLVFDQDEAGRQATASVCAFLPPENVRVATFSEKDPNEMLKANKASELKWACISHAKQYQPEGITTSRKLLTEALRPSERGSDWPWPTLTDKTYGRHPGIYGIAAGVGIGKTEFFHELIHFIAGNEGKPVGIFLLEEAPSRTLKILAGKSLNKPLHRPDVEFNHADVEAVIRGYSDGRERLFLFDHKGSRDWKTIFSQAKYLAAVHGVRNIIIDPLTAIISHEENTDRALHALMADMSALAQSPYNCTVYYSSHLNEPPRDRRPHEEGGRVHESQLAGSRAMIRASNYIIGLERNKQDPDVVKRNTTTLRILKDRDFGSSTGETFEIYYDQETGRYLEPDTEF